MEIWENIIGYDGDYQISNYGNVKSFKYRNERILKFGVSHNGYYDVKLYKDGIVKGCRINRLVGTHFIPNPLNLPVVNHLDGDKSNNHYLNLQWSTSGDNNQHAYDTGLRKPPSCKRVIQLDKQGNFIKEYESTCEAGRQCNLHQQNISSACRGKLKTCGGFKWQYK